MSREDELRRTRNIGIMAHIDAGKTTTTERILYYTHKIHKIGETYEGAATMDWMPLEQERGITITSAATTCYWKNNRINIIDTPGHVDFTVEVERSLRVLDGAITVLDGKNGVEPQTETVWRQGSKYNVPRIVLVNKMDAVGADFEMSVRSLHTKLAADARAVQYPIGSGPSFAGVVDVIERRAYFYGPDKDVPPEERDVPAALKDTVERVRGELLEALASYDDELMLLVLDNQDVPVDLIKATIRKATISGSFFPVFCGSAYKNKGIRLLLDGVVDYLPSPLDVPEAGAEDMRGNEVLCPPEDEAPLAALAFKIMTDPYIGRLAYVRVYSGVIRSGSYVYNPAKKVRERIMRAVLMHANQRLDVPVLHAGDIGAVVGLKSTVTGDTLCEEKNPLVLERMVFPEPVIEEAVEPKSKADQEKMSVALGKLAEEDPTFRVHTNTETGQTIIAGVGELQLDIIVDRMRREFGVQVNVGAPQVGYRETIRQSAACQGRYVRQSGGHGQYGDVWIRFEPNRGKGFEFVNAVVGGAIPKEFIRPTEEGLKEAMQRGLIAGYQVIDVKATLFDGSYHEVDSSDGAYRIAASLALREAARKCRPVILEPIMKIEVTAPEEYYGDVVGDISRRRGNMTGETQKGGAKTIEAEVPLAEMFGYVTDLRSLTQGRGSYTMQFGHYGECPKAIQEEMVRKSGPLGR